MNVEGVLRTLADGCRWFSPDFGDIAKSQRSLSGELDRG